MARQKSNFTGVKQNPTSGKWIAYLNGEWVAQCKDQGKAETKLAAITGVKTEEIHDEEKITFGINERFDFIEKFVRMVARGVSNSLIVAGPGGLGKTHTVIETLEAMGKHELNIGDLEGDFIVVKGFSTAKALYRTLWENNGKIIIFDDTDAVIKDPIGSNIFKAALDSYDKRVISWNADFPEREELPNRFEFIGKVIFITNMSIDKIPQAIVSRSLKCDVSMTIAEKVERIETIIYSNDFMRNISMDVKHDTVIFIKEHAEKFTDLNIRSAMTIAKIRNEFDDADWSRIALYIALS